MIKGRFREFELTEKDVARFNRSFKRTKGCWNWMLGKSEK